MAQMSDSLERYEQTAAYNATFCATLVDEWVRAGVTNAVVSPGSRSTPMALALADRPEIDVQVHVDERSAAFVALGIGLATRMPAVVLTTSGTAAVELHPAVVEAHQAAVPLLVVTADRPPELHHVGAAQTVDQTHLFGGAVRLFVEPGPPDFAGRGAWRSLGARAVVESLGTAGTSRTPGPVHLNLAFREPLIGEVRDLPAGRPSGEPWHRASLPGQLGSTNLAVGPDHALSTLTVDGSSVRGLIVAGAGCGEADIVLRAAEQLGWPVLADPRSGCRTGHPLVITTVDTWLRDQSLAAELTPDLVIRLGEPLASKVVATWLAGSGATQVAVERYGRWFDPDRTATIAAAVDPARVMADLAARSEPAQPSTWIARWRGLEDAAQQVLMAELGRPDATLSDPAVARVVSQTVGEYRDATLVVSSSMPIRDLEWYGGSLGSTEVLANRGANGIDGVLSTAVGVAVTKRKSNQPTIAVLGDLAFLHDTNAMLGLAARHVDLTVVVIDNNGGGIFSFLPQSRQISKGRFEELFGTPHGADLAGLARAHGLVVESLSATHTVNDLRVALNHSLEVGGTRVLIVSTDRAANVEIHESINRSILARR